MYLWPVELLVRGLISWRTDVTRADGSLHLILPFPLGRCCHWSNRSLESCAERTCPWRDLWGFSPGLRGHPHERKIGLQLIQKVSTLSPLLLPLPLPLPLSLSFSFSVSVYSEFFKSHVLKIITIHQKD